MIQIDKGVPMPARANEQQGYPFAAMEVGDSFFVGAPVEAGAVKLARYVGVAAMREKKRLGFSFAVRRVVEGGVAGARVWRTA